MSASHTAPDAITLTRFTPDHIPGALRLSQEAGWPHRAEDWALTLSVSDGVVALEGDRVVGTALLSSFGPVAMVNMIIVDAAMRGRGLGRRLMNAVLESGADQELRLTATTDGLPLYEKLGFEVTGAVVQHQGVALPADPGRQVSFGAQVLQMAELDRAASGLERATLLDAIAADGEVLSCAGGFALLRDFGRGKLLGPVVARDCDTACALIRAAASHCAGQFLRIDLTGPALSAEMEALGLNHVGGGTAMALRQTSRTQDKYKTYALVSQALG